MAFVLDVAGYGARPVPDRDSVQQRLRQLVVATLAECGLNFDAQAVDHQWTGDGINAILPADIDPTAVLTTLVRSLASSLSRDNAGHTDRIRLRMAVGVGLVERGPAGFTGPVIVDINRLVDSAVLRSVLVAEPAADLAVAVSDQAHVLVIEPGYPGIPAGQFTRVNVVAKEFTGPAWIWVSTRQWSELPYLPPRVTDPRDVGRYRVVARLGAGQAGTVYLAAGGPGGGAGGHGAPGGHGVSGGHGAPGGHGASGGDPGWAALKVFSQHLAADQEVRRRLSVGALASSVVREPRLASVIDYDTADKQGQPWVASTLVPGPSLAATVTETGPLPAAAGWIALGLVRALAALHEAGLTHCAVSPRNVVLDSHGPVLTDFGISRAMLLTGPGTPADDVLMLGATAFFAATGRSPWGGPWGRPWDDAFPALPPAGTALPGDAELAGCPSWLAPVVLACLAPEPAARPTAADLHRLLAAEAGQQPRSWLPPPVAARVAEYQALPPSRGRFRWARGRY